MKTIDNKKTAVAIFIFSLFFSFFISPTVLAEENNTSITEEVVEQELMVEPWMTNIDEFNKMTNELGKQNQTYISEEIDENPIPVEPWMTNIDDFNKMTNELCKQNQTCFSEECDEDSIPIEPWMFNVSYLGSKNNSTLESKKMVALITTATKELQIKLL